MSNAGLLKSNLVFKTICVESSESLCKLGLKFFSINRNNPSVHRILIRKIMSSANETSLGHNNTKLSISSVDSVA